MLVAFAERTDLCDPFGEFCMETTADEVDGRNMLGLSSLLTTFRMSEGSLLCWPILISYLLILAGYVRMPAPLFVCSLLLPDLLAEDFYADEAARSARFPFRVA